MKEYNSKFDGMDLVLKMRAQDVLHHLEDYIRFDNGFVPTQSEQDQLAEAIRKERPPFPSEQDIMLLVMGDAEGVVPQMLTEKWPNISAVLSELLT